MRIAILGGRFDPPHIGHFLIAQQTLELIPHIDRLLLVPAATHQWKPTEASEKDRLTMLAPFAKGKIEISDTEIKRGGISYSIDTIRHVKQQTKAEIFWIVGSDILSEFDRWEKKDELTRLATFLVFPRDPYHLPKRLPKGFTLVKSPDLLSTNISSTVIRNRIKAGKSISHLVPRETEEYIIKHELYKL